MRPAGFLLLGFLLLVASSLQARSLEQAELIFAGLLVNGGEAGEVDAWREGSRYWFPLPMLEEALGIRVEETAGRLRLVTPIGEAELPLERLGERDGKRYVSAPQLDEAVRVRVTFDQSAYAFRFEVPWRPGGAGEREGKRAEITLRPDIPAPDTSLGFLRWRTDYERAMESGEDGWVNTLDTGGALGDGTWLIGLRQQDRDQVRLDRWFWNRVFRRNALRLGTSYVDLGILLDSYHYTGAQWAWSSGDISRYTDFETDLNFDSFLREDIEAQRDIIRDDGPPGGIAELRVDGRPVARVRVGLDGHYEFRDIPWRQGAFQSTQVWLYQRSLSDQPVVVDLTRTMLRQMLARGEWLVRGGLGQAGNALYDDYGTPEQGEGAGFLLTRYGFSDWLTGQLVAQRNSRGEDEWMGGLRMSLGSHWGVAFDLASRDGRLGFSGELQGWAEEWELQLRSRYYQQHYRSNDLDSEYDHYLRAFWRWSDFLRIGLVGRHHRDYQLRKIDFLLPGAYWNPAPRLSLSAVPNNDGNYRVQGDWYFDVGSRAGFVYENDLYTLTLDRDLRSGLHAQLGADYQRQEEEKRLFGRIDWYLDENQYNYLQAGVSHNFDAFGWFLSWNRIFTPGVEAQIQYLDDFRSVAGFDGEPQLQVLLRIDLAGTGRRLVPTDNRRINFSRGGIAGFIRDEEGRRIPVDDVEMRINGRRLPQYQAGGAFAVGNLRPGIYEVSLDEGKLPIEYVPERKRYLVEVGRAAVTQVDFLVRAEYGLAGRITDAEGKAVAGARVEILGAEGQRLGITCSGRFGYYRFDGLRKGEYLVRVTAVGRNRLPEPWPERGLEIRDDYLFGQDLRIVQPLPPSDERSGCMQGDGVQ